MFIEATTRIIDIGIIEFHRYGSNIFDTRNFLMAYEYKLISCLMFNKEYKVNLYKKEETQTQKITYTITSNVKNKLQNSLFTFKKLLI